MSEYYVVLTNRNRKWERLLQIKQPKLHKNQSAWLKRYVRKGIPGRRSNPA